MMTRSQRGVDNVNMTLGKEKIPIHTMIDILNMKMVKQAVHQYQIVTYAEKTVIM